MPDNAIRKVRLAVLTAALAFGLAFGVNTATADQGQQTVTLPGSSVEAPPISAAATAALSTLAPVPGIQFLTAPGSGQMTAHFDYAGREAICRGALEAFTVDDTSGSINGIMPGSPSWPAEVNGRNPRLVFASSANPGAAADLPFQGGDIVAFRFTGCSTYYYSFQQANPDGQVHMLASQDTSGQNWQLGWEDLSGSGGDYNDMVVNVTGLQGGGTPPPDTTPPPAPQITDSPPDTFNSAAASFSFTDDEAGVTFLCRIGTAVFEGCTSPQSYSGLAEGSHTFSVEAEDAAGNVSPATTYSWTIDLGPCTQGDPRCALTAEGSSSSEVSDPTPCGATTASDTSTATPDAACAAQAKKVHCAWFYDDEPIDGTTKLITFVIHQFTPHIQFHYCVVWGKAVTSVDGISASNVYKKYPWVYRGLLQDPVVGGLGSRLVKVTINMNYQQCAVKDFGCFDSRDVVLEATIDAKSKNRANPVTVTVRVD
jgi:hypothetical protein